VSSGDKRLRQLEAAHRDLEKRIGKQSGVRNLLSFAILAGTVATPIAWIVLKDWRVVSCVGALVVVAVGWWTTRLRLRELESDQRQVEYEIAVVHSKPEDKAETLYLKHQFELKRYYDQTLRHGDYVFYVGVLGLIASLIIVGMAFWLIKEEETTLGVDITVAALAAVGALFSNSFVVLYRQMHGAALDAVTDFHQRLVDDNELHFANLLATQAHPKASARIRKTFGRTIVKNHHRDRRSPPPDG